MRVEAFLKTTSFALAEASVYERLRRHREIRFDPHLAHATLIYDAAAASILERVHREYFDIAQRHDLAMFAATDGRNCDRIARVILERPARPPWLGPFDAVFPRRFDATSVAGCAAALSRAANLIGRIWQCRSGGS